SRESVIGMQQTQIQKNIEKEHVNLLNMKHIPVILNTALLMLVVSVEEMVKAVLIVMVFQMVEVLSMFVEFVKVMDQHVLAVMALLTLDFKLMIVVFVEELMHVTIAKV